MIDPAVAKVLGLTQHGVKSTPKKNVRKAPFPYMGSKAASLDEILPRLPQRQMYIEVFGGSGVVLLNRPPCKLEVFNDRYSGVTDFFKALRDHPDELCDYLELMPCSREEWYRCFSSWEDHESLVRRGACWYYMIMYSFGTKGKQFGRCVRPVGSHAGRIGKAIPRLPELAARFANVQIENLDWEQVLQDYDHPEAVFYLDPPYFDASGGIYRHSMTPADHERMLQRIFECRGFVALSGYGNPVYDSPRWQWDKQYQWVVQGKMQGWEARKQVHENAGEDRHVGVEKLWIKEAR